MDGGPRPPMAMDAYREGDRLVLVVDLPGVDPSTIEVTVDHRVLRLEAERAGPPRGAVEMILGERPHGRFSRRILLGDALDPDRIEAAYADGVLTLRVHVTVTAPPTPAACLIRVIE